VPIVIWIFRALRWGGRYGARLALEYFAADYLASLASASTKPPEEQQVYRDTLMEASAYPSTLRRVFFELLKEAATEAAWNALVAYARRVRESDPQLQETADDVLAV